MCWGLTAIPSKSIMMYWWHVMESGGASPKRNLIFYGRRLAPTNAVDWILVSEHTGHLLLVSVIMHNLHRNQKWLHFISQHTPLKLCKVKRKQNHLSMQVFTFLCGLKMTMKKLNVSHKQLLWSFYNKCFYLVTQFWKLSQPQLHDLSWFCSTVPHHAVRHGLRVTSAARVLRTVRCPRCIE